MDGLIGILTGRGPACDELQAWLDHQGAAPEQIVRVPGNQIAFQRNQIVRRLLTHSDWPHVLFVDADCIPPLGALDRLASHGLPIVSGCCIERVAPFALCAVKTFEPSYERYRPEDLVGKTEPFPVVSVGAGCLLIRREVFEKLDAPWFRCGQLAPELLTEDTDFCLRAAEHGFPVYLDPMVLVGHETRVALYPGEDGQVWARWPGPLGLLPYKLPLGEVARELHL